MKRHRIDYFNEYELEELFRAFVRCLPAPEWRPKVAFCWVLMATGARIHEACHIRVEHCYPDYIYLWRTKGGKSRDVSVAPECQGFYRQYLSERQAFEWLFSASKWHGTRSHTPISRMTGLRWWQALVDEAGIRYLPPHEGARKSFATFESEHGRMSREADMQAQLGHSTDRVTKQYYQQSIASRRYTQPKLRYREIALHWDKPQGKNNVVHVDFQGRLI